VKLPLPPEEESEFRDVTADPHLDAIRTGLLRGASAQELESLSALNTYTPISWERDQVLPPAWGAGLQ
jgi:hypothetical protein